MSKQIRCNVVLNGNRTSITINDGVLNLVGYIDGTPDLQDLIDEADESTIEGTASGWVTALVFHRVAERLESLVDTDAEYFCEDQLCLNFVS